MSVAHAVDHAACEADRRTAGRPVSGKTRNRIVEQTVRIFNEFGEPNVSTMRIAANLNMSSGNLYYHFASKEELLDTIIERFGHDTLVLLEAAHAGTMDLSSLTLYLRESFGLMWRYRFIYRDLADLLARQRTLEIVIQKILDEHKRLMLGICRALRASGALRSSDAELEVLATNMVALATYWLSFEYVRNPRSFRSGDAISRALDSGTFQVLALVTPYLSQMARATRA